MAIKPWQGFADESVAAFARLPQLEIDLGFIDVDAAMHEEIPEPAESLLGRARCRGVVRIGI